MIRLYKAVLDIVENHMSTFPIYKAGEASQISILSHSNIEADSRGQILAK